MSEQWKECCEGFYEVSDWGRVRRAKPGARTKVGRLLKTPVSSHGYATAHCYFSGKARGKYVHRLVAEAFIGPCPPGKQVNHKDGVKTNNNAANLEYVTPKDNTAHARRTGLCRPQRRVMAYRHSVTEHTAKAP